VAHSLFFSKQICSLIGWLYAKENNLHCTLQLNETLVLEFRVPFFFFSLKKKNEKVKCLKKYFHNLYTLDMEE